MAGRLSLGRDEPSSLSKWLHVDVYKSKNIGYQHTLVLAKIEGHTLFPCEGIQRSNCKSELFEFDISKTLGTVE